MQCYALYIEQLAEGPRLNRYEIVDMQVYDL